MNFLSPLFLVVFLSIAVLAQTPTPTPTIKETVNISANNSQTVEQVSKTINVISAKEMRERADFSLAETLKTIPGFRVQQLGGFGHTATIKTRGLRNQDTAILIDGFRFRDATAIGGDASPFLSDFTLTSVSKIEVLRGSGSSLYGTNAIGGVVDFQTPRPTSPMHGQISGAWGGYGLQRYRANFSDGTVNGKFGYNLGVSRTLYSKGIDGDDPAHNANFQSRLEYNPFHNTNISTRFFVADGFVKLNSSPDTFGTLPASSLPIINAKSGINFVSDVNDPDNSQKSNFFNGQFVISQIINDKIFFQISYQGLKTGRKYENGVLGSGYQSASMSFFDGQIHTANGHFNWTPNAMNNITSGYEFETEQFGNNGFTPNGLGNFFVKAKQSSNTFYVQDLVSILNNKLQIAGGFRTQFFRLNNPQFSTTNSPFTGLTLANPSSAYTYDLSSAYFFEKLKTKFRAHVGNGYRVPSLYERFGTYYYAGSFFRLGNPDLKPERSIGLDGGIEQSIYNNRVKYAATFFYTKVNDEITYLPTESLNGAAYFNFDKHYSRGAEFSSNISATKTTDVFASYTYTNSDIRNYNRQTSLPSHVFSSDSKSYGIPDHQFSFVATQHFKNFWINADFLATSSYLAPIFSNSKYTTYIYRFAGNRNFDLTLGNNFKLKNDKTLRLFTTVENLFNYNYFENGFRTTGRNVRVGLSFGF